METKKYTIGILQPSSSVAGEIKMQVINIQSFDCIQDMIQYMKRTCTDAGQYDEINYPDYEEIRGKLKARRALKECLLFEPFGCNLLGDFVFGLTEAFKIQYEVFL